MEKTNIQPTVTYQASIDNLVSRQGTPPGETALQQTVYSGKNDKEEL
jgi:hypothetical protein